jgi:hypothetical protein
MTGKTTKLDQCIDLKNTLDYNLKLLLNDILTFYEVSDRFVITDEINTSSKDRYLIQIGYEHSDRELVMSNNGEYDHQFLKLKFKSCSNGDNGEDYITLIKKVSIAITNAIDGQTFTEYGLYNIRSTNNLIQNGLDVNRNPIFQQRFKIQYIKKGVS